MKRIITTLLYLLLYSFTAYSTDYTSAGPGPASWGTNTSWNPVGIPGPNDNVTISAGHTIQINATSYCTNLTINGTLSWISNKTLVVRGNYNVTSTGSEVGKGIVQFNAPGTTITVTGVSSTLLSYYIYSARTVTSGSVVNKTSATTSIQTNATLTNLGSYTMGTVDPRTNSSFINGSGGSLSIKTAGFMAGHIFTANAVPNTVTLIYATGAIPTPTAGFYNLTIGSSLGVKTLAANTVIAGQLQINTSNTISANGFNLSLGGNMVNNGTFTPDTRTVTFNGTSTISGSSTTSFYNVTINGTLTGHATSMNVAGNWTNNGVYNHNSSTVVFNGTSLITGSTPTTFYNLTMSGTLTGHPTNMNVARNWVNNGTFTHNNGTVTFNGTTVVSGSTITSFRNVTISGALTAHATNMNVAGNWINNGTFTNNNSTVTFNGTTAVSGSTATNFRSVTISGTLTGHTSNMNVSGNWINNGTYTHNGGTVTFNGNSPVTGISTTNFNNITISGSLTGHPTDISVSGNWTNNGTFTHNNGTVTFFGSTLISGSSTTTFNNIIISGILTGHSSTLNIAGNFTDNGVYNSNGGLLVFNGATPQIISGSGTGTFESLTLSNASGLSVNSGFYNLEGVLTLTAGTLANTGGTFTLISDVSRYARIAPVSQACGTCGFSGNFIIQRHIPARTIGTWADLSPPVSNATMVDWDNELFMVYPFDGFNNVTNRPRGTNVLAYDEVSAAYYELNPSTSLSAGQGFEIGLTDDATLANFTTTTLTTSGTPNFGTFNIPLSFTAANGPAYPIGYSGENLIGNPYASAIALNSISITNALSTVDVYDYTIDNYRTLSGTDLIGPYQGFWAYAQNSGASFIISETSKSTNTTTAISRINEDAQPYFNLLLASADGSHGMQHHLKVACNENSSDGWDTSDHPFRKSLNTKAPSITSNAGDIAVTINTFNSNHETYIMPLNVQVGIEGKYQISSSGIKSITKDFCVVLLEDTKTKQFFNLVNSPDYTFVAGITDSKNRFVLHFSKSPDYKPTSTATTRDELDILQNSTGNVIHFNFTEPQRTSISVVDITGRRIIEDINITVHNQTLTVSLPDNFHGMYLISVQSDKKKTVQKFIAP